MGWASGSEIVDSIAEVIEDLALGVCDADYAIKRVIEVARNHDCDTIDECDNPLVIRAWREICFDEGIVDNPED